MSRTVALVLTLCLGCGGGEPTPESSPSSRSPVDSAPPQSSSSPGPQPSPASADAGATPAATGRADASSSPDVARPVAAPPPAPDGGVAAPPAPWRGKDIGDLATARGESMSGPTAFFFKFGGRDIGGAADSFYFVHQAVKGDCQIIAKLTTVTAAPAAKLGLMMRTSLEPGSPNVFLTVFGDEAAGGQLQSRTTPGGATGVTMKSTSIKQLRWLRLVRQGRTVTAFRGDDFGAWNQIASATLDLPAEALVGVAMANQGDIDPGSVEIDDIQVDNLAADPASASWFHDDIGSVGGTAVFNAGAFAVTGWGEPPTPTRFRFSIAYRQARGPQTLTARLPGFTTTAKNGRAGLMMRDVSIGLGAGSPSSRRSPGNNGAWIYAAPGGGVVFEYRNASGTVVKGGSADLAPPLWLRVQRLDEGIESTRLAGFVSKDGQTWMPLGMATTKFTYTMWYVAGLFSMSGDYVQTNTATFDSVTLQ